MTQREFPSRLCILLRAAGACARSVALLMLVVPVALAQDRDNCLFCHQYPGLSRWDAETDRVRLFYVDPAYTHDLAGPHARLACTDCHLPAEVGVVPHRALTPVDCARQCHLVSPNAPPRRFSHENIARMLPMSVHTPEALRAMKLSGEPLLAAGQSLCLYCHDEPVFRHDLPIPVLHAGGQRCDACHTTQFPIDAAFMLRHVAARLKPARPPLEQAQACSVCHSDPAFLAQRDATDPVAGYVRSFHGKSALLGDDDAAACVDCHVGARQNVHLMLRASDPHSSVHPDRVADSCLRCHTDASPRIAATAVHLDLPTSRGSVDFLVAFLFILLTIVTFVPSALIVIGELGQIVAGRHAPIAASMHALTARVMQHPLGRKRLARFAPRQRLQHWMLALLFVLLALTGFPMKFADQLWAKSVIGWFGGLGTARIVHHWAGVALIAGFSLHMLSVTLSIVRNAAAPRGDGRRTGLIAAILSLPMVLNREDVRRLGQLFRYLLGLSRDKPVFGKFSASEKFEYFGVFWGCTLLGATGLMLWGEQLVSHFLGGRAFNIAQIMHTYEAFLAVIHVGILHIVNVALAPAVFPLSMAMITGRAPLLKLAEDNGEFVRQVARELGIPLDEPPSPLAEVSGG